MGKPHKHAELIKAWADGAEIQCKCWTGNEWRTIQDTPQWHENRDYRIKPEPKPDVVFYVNANLDRAKSGEIYSTTTCHHCDNIKLTFDGETGKLKSAEVLE